ncbi:MAG: flagellar basal body-associated protein FliL [Burkholderiales bacterium]|nr:flagellar basal body-associated protein FliL [Burkholderiales bacterium]
MAKATEKPAEATESAKKKNPLMLVIVILLVLIVLGGGGFGYWFMTHNKSSSQKIAAEPATPPVYTVLDTFTVNLKDPGIALQTDITLKVRDEKVGEAIKARMPEIRNDILLQLSNQHQADLSSSAGKEKLGQEIMVEVNKVLQAKSPSEGVSQVLFTSFIIQ